MSSPSSLPIPGRTDESLDSQRLREQEKKEARKKFFDRHQQLKDRLDEELALEAKAEENLKAKARQVEDSKEHPQDWQRARDAHIQAEKQRKGAYLRMWSIKDFTSLKVLGKGSFGVVHLVRRQGTEEVYALKQIRKDHFRNKNRMKAYNERDAMAKGFGLWFTDLLCTFQDSGNLYLVMEFMQGGDFFAYMEKKNKLSIYETKFYVAELVQAIDAIHQSGFIHRAFEALGLWSLHTSGFRGVYSADRL